MARVSLPDATLQNVGDLELQPRVVQLHSPIHNFLLMPKSNHVNHFIYAPLVLSPKFQSALLVCVTGRLSTLTQNDSKTEVNTTRPYTCIRSNSTPKSQVFSLFNYPFSRYLRFFHWTFKIKYLTEISTFLQLTF